METLLKIVQTVNSYLSDYILIVMLVAAGLLFSIKTRFVQVRYFGAAMRKAFGEVKLFGKKHDSGMSSFQALTTAIAAQVGTGNIVGASGAILIGGPGAIFWMWIIAFFGMATIYAEAVLAQTTRVVHEDGTVSGGPVYYITTAFKGRVGKFLAGFFAVAIILALGFMGAMVQSNSIAEACHNAFGVPSWVVGVVIAAVCAFIFIGGVQRIASVSEKIVPVMATLYLIGGLVILIARIRYVPETIGMIFKYAFVPNALIGGSIGYALKTAISQGVKRGLFSNEAGMGSTPHAHAQANVKTPHEQGIAAMAGVFIDTFVVLTMTALVVISTLYAGNGVLRLRRCRGHKQDEHGTARVLVGDGQRLRQRVRRDMPAVLRVLHHCQLEHVRPRQLPLPLRQEGQSHLLRHRDRVHLPRLAAFQRPRLGADGYVQPAHGRAERHSAAGAVRHRRRLRQGRRQPQARQQVIKRV